MNQLRTKLDHIKLTKIDVAEAHMKAAVRLYFEDADPVPIYSLAAAAREVLTKLGDKLKIRTVLREFADERQVSFEEVERSVHEFAAFMKHANRDPTSVLEFDPNIVTPLLFIVSHDFWRVTGGIPAEAQIYQAWCYATHVERVSDMPLRSQRKIRSCIDAFPMGLRGAVLAKQKQIGLEMLNRYANDPALIMEIKRIIEPRED